MLEDKNHNNKDCTFIHGAKHYIMCQDGKMVQSCELHPGMRVVVNTLWASEDGYASTHINTKTSKYKGYTNKFKKIREPNGMFGHEYSEIEHIKSGYIVGIQHIGKIQCYDIEIIHDDPDDGRDWTQHNYYQGEEGSTQLSGELLCVKNSCCGAAHRNSFTQTSLVYAKLLGTKPVETSLSITYAAARGNGRLSWGSGLNLQPMSKWASKIGNYLTSDMGRYTTSGSGVNSSNQQKYAGNALQYQSIPCYVKDTSFDTFYEIARAGIACNIGGGAWPSGATIDSNGMAVGSGRSTGGHATSMAGFAIEINGKKYILWTNSHGARYKQGTRIKQSAFGCFATKDNWSIWNINTSYGRPYLNFGEGIKNKIS